GLVLLLFVAVYVPGFIVIAGLKLSLKYAVPLLIAITPVLACFYIWLLTRRSSSFREYGFRLCNPRYLLLATVLALVLGLPLSWIAQKFATADPFSGAHFKLWMLVLYFPIAAAIQEEVIFRGLLQTALTKQLDSALRLPGNIFTVPVVAIAILFGLIHSGFGIWTVLSAMILGILAGELRQRSGSLLPAFVVHAVFNAASLLWMLV
ncbi:MAG: lysostaphin resistance A-like protein, partial [Gammaproteobacteria bacterium]